MASKKEALEKRIDEMKAKLAAEIAKERQSAKKADSRHKIRLGALLMADESTQAKSLVEKYRKVMEAEDKVRAEKKAEKQKKEKPVS